MSNSNNLNQLNNQSKYRTTNTYLTSNLILGGLHNLCPSFT